MLMNIPLSARDFVDVFVGGSRCTLGKEQRSYEANTCAENAKKLREAHMKTPNVQS